MNKLNRHDPLDRNGCLHELKIQDPHFDDVVSGAKTAEIRLNDRDYKSGDEVVLWQWSERFGYTGSYVTILLTHVLKEYKGIERGFALLSFRKINQGSDKNWNYEHQKVKEKS